MIKFELVMITSKLNLSVKERLALTKTDPQFRCFNFGYTGHESSQCRNKDKCPCCFNCSTFGHKSAQCDLPLIDTSSEKTLLKESV